MISPVEGELRVRKDAELDRENIAFYNLTIAARDRGVPPLSSTVSPPGWRGGLRSAVPHPPVPSLESPPSSVSSSPCPWGFPPSDHSGLGGEAHLFPGGGKKRMGGTEIGATCPHRFSPYQILVGVRVLDINDNDPVLLNLPMNITLSENAPISSFVTRILARDADKGLNALLTFDITAGNTENAFYINSTVRPQGVGGQDMESGHPWSQSSAFPGHPWVPSGILALAGDAVGEVLLASLVPISSFFSP